MPYVREVGGQVTTAVAATQTIFVTAVAVALLVVTVAVRRCYAGISGQHDAFHFAPLAPMPIVCSESCYPLLTAMSQTKQVITEGGGN